MNVEVTKHKVIISKDSEPTHENEYKITECNFTYDEYIESFHVKRAIFTILSTGEKYETDIINNKCYIPYEVLTHEFETVKLGVYAFNIDEDGETPVLGSRVSPSHALFVVNAGSYLEGAVSPEIITPSQYDLYSDALQEGLDEVDEKLDEIVETVDEKLEEVDDKLDVVDEKLDDMSTAIEECDEATERTNNLNLDVSDKIDGDVTVTLTKKDLTTKTVVLSDGTSLMFNWDGTKLGIKTDKDSEYVYVDLQGQQGPMGPQGNPFQIKKTYATMQAMIDDYDNMEINDYVMISGNIEQEDNAKLFTKTEVEDPTYRWQYLADFSGATGIQGPPGPTPNIQIGSVTSGSSPSVTRTGTDENPILNFVLQKGDTGEQGIQGETGNGIASIQKTGTSGLVDTYTITYTDGTTSTFTVTNGEDGEVSQKQLDRVAMVYNLIPTVDDTDENITLNKTGEAPLKVDLKGNTYQEVSSGEQGVEIEDTTIHIENVDNTKENYITFKGNTYQESTNGNNLARNNLEIVKANNTSGIWNNNVYTFNGTTFTYNDDGSVTVNGTASANAYFYINRKGTSYESTTLNAGTYYYSCGVDGSNSTWKMQFNDGSSHNLYGTEITYTYTEITEISFYILVYSGQNPNGVTFYPMVSTTSGATYEPFTNGPSPNPDYPQDVQIVKGNNTIKVVGKNLFDKNNTLYSSKLVFDENYTKFQTTSSSTRMYYMKCNPNTTYSISKSVGTILRCGNCNEIPANNVVISSSYSAGSSNQVTFTTNNDKYIYIYLLTTSETSTISYESVIETLQVEKNATVTNYEAYQGQSYPIILPVKNLFDKNNANIQQAYISNGSLYNTSTGNVRTIIFPAKPNTTYTVSKHASVSTTRLAYSNTMPSNGDTVLGLINVGTGTNGTITTGSEAQYLLCYVYASDETLTIQEMMDTIQIEECSQANSYTPFGVEPIELYKVGTHFDYFYKSNNKWYLRKETAKGIFNGTENWELSQHYTGSFYIDGNNGVIQPTYAYSQLFCNNFARANINSSTQLSNFALHTCYMALASGGMEFWYDDGTASVQDFKNYLSLHNMYVYYILSTPVITEITDTTLKSQLDALYTAQLNSGINNINTETNNLLPYINLQYNTISPKPTPEHPSEILNVTGNNTIIISNNDNTKIQTYSINLGSMELCKIGNYQDYIAKSTGKNLFDKDVASYTGTQWATLDNYIEVKQNQTYTLQGLIVPTNWSERILFYDENKNELDTIDISNTNNNVYTFTTPLNTKYIRFNMRVNTINFDTIQLEEGSTATLWEPSKGKWYKHKEIDKMLYDGSETWTNGKSGTENYYYKKSIPVRLVFADPYPISNQYPFANVTSSNTTQGFKMSYSTATTSQLLIRWGEEQTLEDFKENLSVNNLIFYGVLYTKVNEEITEPTLINQLEDLYNNAISYDIQTNITQTNYKEPFIITATAFMNIKNIIDDLETRIEQLENQ